MARHRRPLTVHDDGLAAVIAPIVTACAIDVAVLVDVDSGMLLDAWVRGGLGEVETLGAAHADAVRALLDAGPPATELILSEDDRRHHVLRSVADPSGGRLVLAVVATGSPRLLRRLRGRLREVSDASLTAGPSIPPEDPEDLPMPAQVPQQAQMVAGQMMAGQTPMVAAQEVPALAQMDTGRALRPPPLRPPPLRPAPAGPFPADGVVVPLPAPRRGPAPPAALPPGRHGNGALRPRLTLQPGGRADRAHDGVGDG
ncbi:MAG TPA: hypothetical protein VGE11_19260 [Pseudonocardia sp.]